MLHKILTAFTALAVVASLLAGAAGQAAAVTGFDSAYFGESAFLTLSGGATGQFAVGFNNTGSTGWLIGSSTQVDLAVCLPDKVTCNTTSPNAAFASAWLSSTAYATSSTTFVGPGQTGFFVYNVTVPPGTASGTYRFNGDLALHGTASMIHPQGYYQDVQIPSTGAAAKLGCVANPTSIEAGTNFSSGAGATSTITVTEQDSAGFTITTDSTNTVTLSQAGGLGATLGSGAPDASQTKTFASGVATFTLTAPSNVANTGTDQLSASSPSFPGLIGCQTTVTFTGPGAATALGLSLAQTSFPAGAASAATAATATLLDANGFATSNGSTAVTVNFVSSDTTICTVNASTATIAANAAAPAATTTETFTMTGVPGSCTITASATGLTSASATAKAISAGPAAQLVFVANTCSNTPTTASTQSSSGTTTITTSSECYVKIAVQDAAGNTVFGSGASITVNFYKTGTTTLCSALGGAASLGEAANPYTATIGATSTSLKVFVADSVAQTCDATATSGTLTSATAQVSFTGFGAATRLTATASPQPIPANGASTSTVTVCVRDVAGNKILSGTASTDSLTLFKTTNNGATTLLTSNPQAASSGCASFTVQSTTTVGTDTYTASDASRALSGAGGTATPTVDIGTTTP